jgi:hypothetical protein
MLRALGVAWPLPVALGSVAVLAVVALLAPIAGRIKGM